jgi:predicted nucleic acid-binding protein
LKRVVVDASVLIAALLKDGTVRDALLRTVDVAFSAPAYLREEVGRHISRIASRSRVPQETVRVLIEDFLSVFELVPPGAYAAWMVPAGKLSRLAGAIEDAEYVALALALHAPIWTLDRDFSRIPGIRVLATRDVTR